LPIRKSEMLKNRESKCHCELLRRRPQALRDLSPKAVCTRCGMIGADVRPNRQEREKRESLIGAQWQR
jgi:hypothetical protein